MKRLIAVAVMAMFCLVPSLALAADSEYNSSTYGFRIMLPDGWKVVQQTVEANFDMTFGNSTGQNMTIKIFNNEPKSFDEMTQDVIDEFVTEYIPDYTGEMSADALDFTVQESKVIRIDGRKGLYVLAKAHYSQGVETTVEHYMVIAKGNMYTVTFSAVSENYGASRALFDKMADSFHIQ
ncbi:MAG: PsbP-related protein [Negativicutes bacterium]|nr:PsbP-related protein [Negativicutes bacterium]